MALNIRHLRDMKPSNVILIADRRLWLAADRRTLVEDGSPEAAVLLAAQGREIKGDAVQRLGLVLVDDRVVQVGQEPPPDPEPLKMVAKPEDKARAAPAAKSRRDG